MLSFGDCAATILATTSVTCVGQVCFVGLSSSLSNIYHFAVQFYTVVLSTIGTVTEFMAIISLIAVVQVVRLLVLNVD